MQNPFKFLDSYTKDDREIFFGRDKEIEELYSRVFESNLLLVCGLSGTGKSSLIHCGLSSKFSDSDWLPVVVRRAGNINASLIRNLANYAITLSGNKGGFKSPSGLTRPTRGNFPPKAEPPLAEGVTQPENYSLSKALQSLYLDHFKPIYLIFDQVEELFIFGTKEERDVFIKQVAEVVNSQLQCKFIFVIREEYLAGLIEFERVIPQFFTNRVRIEKMSRHNAVEAIEGPCRVAGIPVEEGFAEQLLEKLSLGKSEVELTYLQVLLDKLFKTAGVQEGRNAGEIQFTISLMEKVGRISDVLADFLEEQIAKIIDSDNALAVLKSFVSLEGTKKVMSSEEITEFTRTLGKPLAKEQTENFIRQFVDLRILRDKDENGKYELRHDSLAAKIYEKITVVEKELIEVRQFVENAYKNYQKRKVLLNESDLKYIALYEGKLYLKEQLNEFIKKSKAEAIKKKRRRRNVFIGGVILLFIILSGFTFWALRERSHALHALQAKEKAEIAKKEAEDAKIRAEEEKRIAEEKLGNYVVISPAKMNVFYIGVENPVDIAVSGYKNEQIFATINSGYMRRNTMGGYIVSGLEKPGKCEIDVSVEMASGKKQRLGKKEFRVKLLPTPQSMFARKSGLCDITKGELLSNEYVVAVMENFDFDIKCLVTGFNMKFFNQGLILTKKSNNNRITKEMKEQLKKRKKGEMIIIDNIQAKLSDGTERTLPPIIIRVK